MEIFKEMKAAAAELAVRTRTAQIRNNASDILKSWVAMTPDATPKFIADKSVAALAAAEALYEVDLAMRVPDLEPVDP